MLSMAPKPRGLNQLSYSTIYTKFQLKDRAVADSDD